MRTSLIALALACALPAAGQAQFESDQETLNIQAQINELENIVLTKKSDLDFGDVRYLVTDVSGTGTYGWSALGLDLDASNEVTCASTAPFSNGVQIVQLSTPSGAGIHLDGDESEPFTISFTGITDKVTDPHLILTRSGGAETIRVGSMRYTSSGLNAVPQITSPTTRSDFSDLATNTTSGFGMCIFGQAELTNGLPAGLYTTTFDVTATYN